LTTTAKQLKTWYYK